MHEHKRLYINIINTGNTVMLEKELYSLIRLNLETSMFVVNALVSGRLDLCC